jgi:hypothetical protein
MMWAAAGEEDSIPHCGYTARNLLTVDSVPKEITMNEKDRSSANVLQNKNIFLGLIFRV